MFEPLTYLAPLNVEHIDDETKFLLALEVFISLHAPSDQNATARVINYIHERHGHYVAVAKPESTS